MTFMEIASSIGAWTVAHKAQIFNIISRASTVTGAVASAIGTVSASKSYRKADDAITDIRENVEHELITEDEARKETRDVIVKTGFSIAKAYLPAVGLVSLSVGTNYAAEKEYIAQNAALLAAFMTLKANYDNYRKRVANAIGEVNATELMLGDKKADDGTVIADAEQGENQIFYFTPENTKVWDSDRFAVINFISLEEAWVRHIVSVDGYAWLNSFLKRLKFRECNRFMGWGWTEDDNIEVRIFETKRAKTPGTYDPILEESYETVIAFQTNAHPISTIIAQRGYANE